MHDRRTLVPLPRLALLARRYLGRVGAFEVSKRRSRRRRIFSSRSALNAEPASPTCCTAAGAWKRTTFKSWSIAHFRRPPARVTSSFFPPAFWVTPLGTSLSRKVTSLSSPLSSSWPRMLSIVHALVTCSQARRPTRGGWKEGEGGEDSIVGWCGPVLWCFEQSLGLAARDGSEKSNGQLPEPR